MRFRISFASLLPRRLRGRKSSQVETGDMKEIERLEAEYTGSFARDSGQHMGVIPPRYGRK
jgi:hypothetical protein